METRKLEEDLKFLYLYVNRFNTKEFLIMNFVDRVNKFLKNFNTYLKYSNENQTNILNEIKENLIFNLKNKKILNMRSDIIFNFQINFFLDEDVSIEEVVKIDYDIKNLSMRSTLLQSIPENSAAALDSKEVVQIPDNKEVVQIPDNKAVVQIPDNKEVVQIPDNKEVVQIPDNKEVVQIPDNKEVDSKANSAPSEFKKKDSGPL
jgi:hypothetical protein